MLLNPLNFNENGFTKEIPILSEEEAKSVLDEVRGCSSKQSQVGAHFKALDEPILVVSPETIEEGIFFILISLAGLCQ